MTWEPWIFGMGWHGVIPRDEDPHGLAPSPDARLASVGVGKYVNISGDLGKTWLHGTSAEANVAAAMGHMPVHLVISGGRQ